MQPRSGGCSGSRFAAISPMPENRHLAKMISTRIAEDNIDSIDKLARGLGISRSDWIRQAILAELVMELAELKREEPQVRDTVNPFLEDLAPEHEDPIAPPDGKWHEVPGP